MIRRWAFGLGLMLALSATAARAGPAADALGRCLVQSATAQDRERLVQWVFTALAQHPALKDTFTLTPEVKARVEREGGAVFERLVLQDCRAQALAAYRTEGGAGLQAGFKTLGQTAGQALFQEPHVAADLAGLSRSMDTAKLQAFIREARRTPSP